jgi:hypothetical protein
VGPFYTNHPSSTIHQAHVQFEHQRNGSTPGQLLVPDGAVGPFYTNCPPSGTSQGPVEPFYTNHLPLGEDMTSSNTHRDLPVSNGVVGPFYTNCPPLVNASNSPPPCAQHNIVGVGEVSPGARPPRYAQGDTHVPTRQHEQLPGDNRPGLPIFPTGLSRPQVGANPGLHTEEHDQSGDKSKSLRGQRLTGQVQHDESSRNLTNDLNDMWESPGVARSEFHSR